MNFNFIDFIFPRQCILCWTTGAYLCKKCKKKLDPHPEICPICHRFSKDYQKCINCRNDKNFILEGIIIPFRYDTILKKLIMKLKYFHKKDISNFLVERLSLALAVNETFQREINKSKGQGTRNKKQVLNSKKQTPSFSVLISFVPTHRWREYIIKGYNQSKILAKDLSKMSWIPRIKIAKKRKYTKTQASLDRKGRLKNLKNAFSLVQNLTLIGNETILIVDDITTTWSTINELAKTIKNHYPKIKIRWAVLWRHM